MSDGQLELPLDRVGSEVAFLRKRVLYLEGLLAQRRAHGTALSRVDDPDAAREAAGQVRTSEGDTFVVRPQSHRHLTLRVFADAYPDELTATEAGQRATPQRDRVTGGTRRTYDLSARGLVLRGARGFTITTLGREVLAKVDQGVAVKLRDGQLAS